MKNVKTLVIALWAVFVSTNAFSQKGNEEHLIKEANGYFNQGEFIKAFPLYSQLVSLYPNHPEYNYKFGTCAIYSESDKSKAVRFLTIATSKGVEDKLAWYYLGKAYHLNYQFKDAIRAYETFIRMADPKVVAKTDAQRQIETCIYGSNLLANIKDISVISKTEADKANFFRYFNLEAIGGKILTVPDELKSKMDMKSSEPGVIHYPGNSTTIYFSSFGKDGSTGKDIYKAQILPDGKFSSPVKLEGGVNTKYDEDYCFMHSDGKTLYFASKGHNSMGGYDIFKSVYDPKTQTFGPAINLDFAINTPDDDIFYIADSVNKKAYFASGRASDLNHLNVYNVLVESTPLQIVYIKGEFISEINPDQKKIGVKIMESNTGRMVCDGISNGSTGNYMLYVPKSGDYSFKVITENSATVHDVFVSVPSYTQPVAVRQEMKLISENGKDKLIVTNHFETPLEEDLSVLAAEMLRKKSNLDVNTEAAPEVTASNNSANTGGGELTTFEKTMENATIAAGFTTGVNIATVLQEMQQEKAAIDAFVQECDIKRESSYAYAMMKQKEAEAAVVEAEKIRAELSDITSDEDIRKLRHSVELADRAEELQREARAALNGAESIAQYKVSEAERANQLASAMNEIATAEKESNYDKAVAALITEKDRRTALRDGNGNAPVAELTSKVKARESEQRAEEQKLTDLREREKSLSMQARAADEKLNNAKKQKDKEIAQNEVASVKTELDNTRKQIILQAAKVQKSSDNAKQTQANLSYFEKVSANSQAGLNASQMVKLSDTDKVKLGMQVDDMLNRVAALEITDPRMLAMVTDSGPSAGAVASANSTDANPVVQDAATNQPQTNNPVATAESKPAAAEATAGLEIRSKTEARLSTASKPELAPARRMIIAQAIQENAAAIQALETKKQNGTVTADESSKLDALVAYQNELTQELASTPSAAASPSADELRGVYTSVMPDYNEKVIAIENGSGSQIDRSIKMMDYKKSVLLSLETARLANARKAEGVKDQSELMSIASKDQQFDMAIQTLKNETGDVNQYKAAFENENKQIIESDLVYADKLNAQIELGENYLSALDAMDAAKQTEMNSLANAGRKGELQIQLDEIREEKNAMRNKIATYKNDLQLTASTSEPVLKTQTANASLEDAMEESAMNTTASAEPAKEEVSDVKKDAVTIEKLFKNREEAESIFAYESGIFEEIVAEHQNGENQLKNRDKIQEINDGIFLLEAEMENEPNPGKLRKLDYKAEQLYLKRSLIEIDNAKAIAAMTNAEYAEESKATEELIDANQAKIEERIMVKDEVRRLKREADIYMANAAEIREKSPAIEDDIERADFCRQAFAKEALAIEKQRQIQNIIKNIDLLNTYSESDLVLLRSGKVPDEMLMNSLAANNGISPESISAEGSKELTSADSNAAATETALVNSIVENAATAEVSNPETELTNKSAVNEAATTTETPSNQTAAIELQPEVNSANQVSNFSTTTDGNIVTDHKVVVADPAGVVNVNLAVNESPAEKSESNAPVQEAMTEVAPVKETTNSVKPVETAMTEVSQPTKAVSENLAVVNTPVSPVVQPAKPAENKPEAASSSSAYMNAEDYFYAMPEYVTNDMFVRTPRAVYSETKPIPVDAAMPKGVYYKVQIGAFRNAIPQNLYDEFAPVCGESLNNGITRYTAGFFVNYNSADQVKKEIRSIGYPDAFVVAFRDGKRIPLYEAMGQTNGSDFAANIEKEYIYGDKGEAPKTAASSVAAAPASTSAPAAVDKPLRTDYYKGGAEVVKATQVETVTGLFYTVQVGVYSKPVPTKSMYNITPLNSELTETQKIRYTAGRFTSMMAAVEKRAEAKNLGIKDAFITAYYNGRRITLSEAERLLLEKGPGILAK